jgi:type VI secretion system secreted protein Hcp
MAIDVFMWFQDYKGAYLKSESPPRFTKAAGDRDEIVGPFLKAQAAFGAPNSGLFEISDYSFDIAQTLNIGAQIGGAGAGKVTFSPFTITRKIDCASPGLFQMACAGTPFQLVGLGVRRSGGGPGAGVMYLAYTFKLVAVKTISYVHDAETPQEAVTFEYGGLSIQYAQQKPDGTLLAPVGGGWDRVRNLASPDPTKPIG